MKLTEAISISSLNICVILSSLKVEDEAGSRSFTKLSAFVITVLAADATFNMFFFLLFLFKLARTDSLLFLPDFNCFKLTLGASHLIGKNEGPALYDVVTAHSGPGRNTPLISSLRSVPTWWMVANALLQKF